MKNLSLMLILFAMSLPAWPRLSQTVVESGSAKCNLLTFSPTLSSTYSTLNSDYPVASIPEELKAGAHAVIRQASRSVEIVGPGKVTETHHRVITVLKAAGKSHGLISVAYDDQMDKAKILEARIMDARGKTIRKLKKKEIQDVAADRSNFHSSNRALLADFRPNQYPYTLEYSFQIQSHDYLTLRPWLPFPGDQVAIEESQLEVRAGEQTFRYRAQQLDLQPHISKDEQGQKVYRWTLSKQQALNGEPFAPPASSLMPMVWLAFDEIEVDGIRGAMDSWEGFSRFYHELNAGRDELPEKLKNKVHELTNGLPHPADKVGALYRFMQENTRYLSIQLGVGGFQTFDAAYVYDNGYGDCKALSNYMAAMLKEIGITAYPCLVAAGRRAREVKSDFPTDYFNHIILCIPAPQDTTWLECTSKHNPPGYLGSFTADRFVLPAMPSGGKLLRTPRLQAHQNLMSQRVELALDPAGSAGVKVKTQRSGSQQDRQRNLILGYGKKEQENWLREQIALSSYELEGFEMRAREEKGWPSCETEMSLRARNCGKKTGSRIFLPLNLFNAWEKVPPEVENRRQAVRWRQSFIDIDTVLVSLPKGYQVESMDAEPTRFESVFGKYAASVTQLPDGRLQYVRRLEMWAQTLPAEAYAELRTFIKQVVKADKQRVVLSDRS